MPKRIQNWINDKPSHRWTTIAVCLLLLGCGGLLAYRTFHRPSPPDAASASQDQIVAFLAGKDFNRVSAGDRQQFLHGMARRYFDMDRNQRSDFENAWRSSGLNRQTRRQIEAQIDLAMASSLAQDYEALPSDQQGPFLDRLLFMLQAIDGGNEFLRWVDSNPLEEAIRNPQLVNGDPGSFEQKLLLGTSSEERARLTRLGRDLLERSRRYRAH
ncbi:MAG: hypothetical protein IT445_12600 [Phycisphaeraceae bacterium]|nr:hypothetical protein [Phycisphaeraceae bacterium]